VLDPWDKPVALTRAWCLYEVVHSLELHMVFHLTVARAERDRLLRAMSTDRAAVEESLTSFDVRSAGLLVEHDREMLLQSIEKLFQNVDRRSDQTHPEVGVHPRSHPTIMSMAARMRDLGLNDGKAPKPGKSLRPARARVPADDSEWRVTGDRNSTTSVSESMPETPADLREMAIRYFNDRTRTAIVDALAAVSWHI